MHFSFRRYDVFISYVVEDREFVEQLYEALLAQGLKVWYAKNQLYPGADIRRVIHEGLEKSRYGIALVSPLYTTHWAFGELFYLMKDEKTLIPIIHNTTVEVLSRNHPELITRYCLHSHSGTDQLAKDIAAHVKARSKIFSFYKLKTLGSRNFILGTGLLLIFTLCIFLVFSHSSKTQPEDTYINDQIDKRITNIESLVQMEIEADIVKYKASKSSFNKVITKDMILVQNILYYRNYYDFFDGEEHIRVLINLKNFGILNNNSSEPPYGLSEYTTFLFQNMSGDSLVLAYSFVNSLPLTYQIIAKREGKDLYEIDVAFSNFLRYAVVHHSVDKAESRRMKRHFLFGIKPIETFVFERDLDNWTLTQIR